MAALMRCCHSFFGCGMYAVGTVLSTSSRFEDEALVFLCWVCGGLRSLSLLTVIRIDPFGPTRKGPSGVISDKCDLLFFLESVNRSPSSTYSGDNAKFGSAWRCET